VVDKKKTATPDSDRAARVVRGARPGTADERAALALKRIRPAYEQVADQLRELVVSGAIEPGDRLPVEGMLSGEFGVSRSTIREAIRLLSSQSLVHTVRGPAGGTFVSDSDPESLRDYLETSIGMLSGNRGVTVGELLEVREALEVPAARLAAKRRTAEHVEAMRDAVTRDLDQSGRAERFQQNEEFHYHVLAAAGNRLLSVVTGPVYNVIQTRFLKDESRPFYPKVHDEHAHIIDCIEASDGDAAATAMLEHLTRLRPVYERTAKTR
jgi:GntR family transcriptional repressor for pyruvate dehydrogenase complex